MMSRLRRSLVAGIVTAAVLAVPALAGAWAGPAPDEPREGLVVIAAPAAGSLAEAGLQPGDVLLSWQRGPFSGVLRWPSGLAEVETEQAPWGFVRLAGRRGDEPMTWQMPAAVRWNLRTRPALSPHLHALYREGAERAAARDLRAAEESWLVAVDEANRAGDTSRAAWFLGHLGYARASAAQWDGADQSYESAVRQVEGTAMAAHLLREWGATFVRRQDWGRAESCYRRALALATPYSLSAGSDLVQLSAIATHRRNLDQAERFFEQALAARRRILPLGSFGQTVRDEIAGFARPEDLRGSGLEIERLRLRLQQLRDRLLKEAGLPAETEGATKTAAAAPKKTEPSPLETLQKALAKAEREAPGSLAVSDLWQELGALAYEARDHVAAEIAWLRALDLREKLAPGTLREARTLHDLGRVHATAKRNRAAASFFCRAAGSLDRLGRMPPASGAPADGATWDALGASPAAYDADCVNALVDAGRTDEAFLAVERSRLRAAEPPLPMKLSRRTQEIDTERNQARARLARLSTSRDRDEVDLLVDWAADLDFERHEIVNPLDLPGIRAALPAGTLLLAWSIGEERSFLFLVRPAEAPGLAAPGPGVEVFPVRARAGDLREKARTFTARAGTVETGSVLARQEAADLYRRLFGPADEQIAAAQRLLLLPDAIVASLPFGSLIRGDSLLGQQKPLQTASSATGWVVLAAKDSQDTKDPKDTESP